MTSGAPGQDRRGHPGGHPLGHPGGHPLGHHDMAVGGGGEPAAQGRSKVGHRALRLGTDGSIPPNAGAPRPSRVSAALLAEAARRVTDRDLTLLRLLQRHRVLTIEQIAALLYDSLSRARSRLPILHRLRLVDRFQPFDPTRRNPSYHYVLDRAGAAILAAEAGRDPVEAARAHRAASDLGLARSQRLRHIIGTNWIYTALASRSRQDPTTELGAWWTEQQCAQWCGDIVRPDAYGRWREHGSEVEFFLEYDRGTEPLHRLTAKLEAYAELETERGAAAWVLLALPGPKREANAHAAVAEVGVPAATCLITDPPRPQDAVWLPVRQPAAGRVRLAELGRLPKPLEALRRAAEGGARSWRFEDIRPDHEEVPDQHA